MGTGEASESPAAREVEVAIIGAGFAGLGMAIKLQEAGIHSFVLLEKGSDVGGTWRDNTYPGCACDIPSHLYSFSFDLNPGWTRMYPTQPEIQNYVKWLVEKYRLRPFIRFGAEVVRAEFDTPAARWLVWTRDGRRLSARYLVLALGGLSRPVTPPFPGLERFRGHVFHSARWDHGYDLTGKSVAVIGTGASAIQFVPQIAPRVAKLSVFQRTAPWILPKFDWPLPPRVRSAFARVPGLMRLFRDFIYLRNELFAVGFTVNPRIMKRAEQLGRAHLTAQVPDPALRKLLTPDYTAGCKRVLLSNDYYPALSRPNVEVVTAGVAALTERGIVDRGGVERPVDTVIFGTGFQATDYLGPFTVVGPDGVDLRETWRARGAEAYLGTTVAGYPNLFLMTGPNTGLGHNSMIFMMEAQLNHILSCLEQMRSLGARTLEVREDVQREFNRRLQQRMQRTVWMTGCKSWYLDEQGRNTTLWPGFTIDFWLRTRQADIHDYRIDARIPRHGTAPDAPRVA